MVGCNTKMKSGLKLCLDIIFRKHRYNDGNINIYRRNMMTKNQWYMEAKD